MSTKSKIMVAIATHPNISREDVVTSIQYDSSTTREYILQALRELASDGKIVKNADNTFSPVVGPVTSVEGNAPSIAPAPTAAAPLSKVYVIRTLNQQEHEGNKLRNVTNALDVHDRRRNRRQFADIMVSILNTSSPASQVATDLKAVGSNAVVVAEGQPLPPAMKEKLLNVFDEGTGGLLKLILV